MVLQRELPLQSHPQGVAALKICTTLNARGHQAVVAGGAVRDFLRGEVPSDLDVATDATPDQIAALFPNTKPVGKAFGVMLVIEGACALEVATFRREGPYKDGRRPGSVDWSSAEEDAKRRDFTVNGLFYDPTKHEIWDFVGGMNDLQRQVICAIGEPANRFAEDHLRVLRAYRFTAQLGFAIEEKTREAVKASVGLLASVSRERVREEILRLFAGSFREQVVPQLSSDGALAVLFPTIPWQLQKYEAWGETFEGSELFEVMRWAFVSLLESTDAKEVTVPWGHFVKSLRLSSLDRGAADSALMFWMKPGALAEMSVGALVERFWDEAFRRGFFEWKSKSYSLPSGFPQINSTELAKKLNLSLSLYESWGGAERPKAWVTAGDLPELTGPGLGQALRRAYGAQLERRFSNKDELKQWLQSTGPSHP